MDPYRTPEARRVPEKWAIDYLMWFIDTYTYDAEIVDGVLTAVVERDMQDEDRTRGWYQITRVDAGMRYSRRRGMMVPKREMVLFDLIDCVEIHGAKLPKKDEHYPCWQIRTEARKHLNRYLPLIKARIEEETGYEALLTDEEWHDAMKMADAGLMSCLQALRLFQDRLVAYAFIAMASAIKESQGRYW